MHKFYVSLRRHAICILFCHNNLTCGVCTYHTATFPQLKLNTEDALKSRVAKWSEHQKARFSLFGKFAIFRVQTRF